MSGLLELAARCEAATGPDRELDALISAFYRVGTEHSWAYNYPAWEGRADGRVYLENGGPSFPAPAYTASLDAAMTLVSGDVGFWLAKGRKWAAGFGDQFALGDGGEADTPALALTAAALRARASLAPTYQETE